jgi:hypothetical protein
MLIEKVSVSTKTARDGKVEISPASRDRLAALGAEFRVLAPTGAGTARLTSMTCTCAKRAGERHVHHFLESDLFRDLIAGAAVQLKLDEDAMTLLAEPA